MNKDIRNIIIVIAIGLIPFYPIATEIKKSNHNQINNHSRADQYNDEVDTDLEDLEESEPIEDNIVSIDKDKDEVSDEQRKQHTNNDSTDTEVSEPESELDLETEIEAESELEAELEADVNTTITYDVKDYILNQQDHLSSGDSHIWNDNYLNALSDETINNIYDKYLKSGGDKDNVRDFAGYLTQSAPVYPNWKEVYENEFDYDEDIIGYEYVGDGVYAVYVEGFEGVFQYVCSRTGYVHG